MISAKPKKTSPHTFVNLIPRDDPDKGELTVLPFPSEHPVLTIKDLQTIVQLSFCIPVCDQRWVYRSQHLTGEETLQELYFRSGDTFDVTYLAKAKITEIDDVIAVIQRFNATEKPTREDWQETYVSMEEATFNLFLPWKSNVSLANRHFFYQQGGIDAFFKLYRNLASKKESFAEDLGSAISLAVYMEIVCLELMWNFSETSYDRKLIMHFGGLELALQALVTSAREPYSKSLADVAVGCIVQYVEYEEAQLVTAKNKDAIDCLLDMAQEEVPGFNNLYSSQIAANTLFCCSCCPDSHPHLVANCAIKFEVFTQSSDPAIRYFCCCFLANLRSSRTCLLDESLNSKMDEQIAKFLQAVKPEKIHAWETSHTYVWVSMLPFLDLAFKSGQNLSHLPPRPREVLTVLPGVHSLGTPVTQSMGIFCIDHLTMVEENRNLFVQERLLEYLICLSWRCSSDSLYRQMRTILHRFGKVAVRPPSLKVLAASVLAGYEGLFPVLNLVQR